MKKLQLSPSGIALFKDCPRCFWLDKNERKPRPRGIFPSLPGGIDLILKTHYDTYRMKGELPPEIRSQLQGSLFRDLVQLNQWRNWRTGLSAETDLALVVGALDDLFLTTDGLHCPYDFKTKGSLPKSGDSEKYYGHQMDIYDLMLNHHGMKTSGKAHLAYYSPKEVIDEEDSENPPMAPIDFHCTVVTIETSASRGMELINAAAKCLGEAMPAPGPSCEYCAFAASRNGGHK